MMATVSICKPIFTETKPICRRFLFKEQTWRKGPVYVNVRSDTSLQETVLLTTKSGVVYANVRSDTSLQGTVLLTTKS